MKNSKVAPRPSLKKTQKADKIAAHMINGANAFIGMTPHTKRTNLAQHLSIQNGKLGSRYISKQKWCLKTPGGLIWTKSDSIMLWYSIHNTHIHNSHTYALRKQSHAYVRICFNIVSGRMMAVKT